jgi:hypothetical protein
MKAHRRLILAALALALGACSSPTSSAPPQSGQIDAATPRYGVMYGSGNRSSEEEGQGSTENVQTIMAADSVETAATVAGGVMYGSGN